MQVVDQIAHFKAAHVKVRQGLGKQRHIVRLEPDFAAVNEKIAVLHQLPGMRQPALGILGALGPRVAEVDVDALDAVLRRKHLADILDVVPGDHHVLHRFVAVSLGDVAARITQDIAGDVHGNEVHIRVVVHHGRGRNALAAAQLQIERLIQRKHFPPASPVRFSLVRKVWANGQLRLRPFLCAHMHGYLSSKFNRYAAASTANHAITSFSRITL